MAQHRIRRLNIQVRTRHQQDALILRQRFSSHWEEILSPFEHHFDRLQTEQQQYHHIPPIRLCVKLNDINDFNGLPDQIEQQLSVLFSQVDTNHHSYDEQAVTVSAATNAANDDQTVTNGQNWNPVDILCHYLQSGSLPWFCAHEPNIHDHLQTWVITCQQQLQPRLVSEAKVEAIVRWLQLLPNADIYSQVLALLNTVPQALDTVDRLLMEYLITSKLPYKNEGQRWFCLAAFICQQISFIQADQILSAPQTLLAVFAPDPQQKQQWLDIWQRQKQYSQSSRLAVFLQQLTTMILTDTPTSRPVNTHTTITPAITATATEQIPDKFITLKSELTPISLAGGILIYPYLKTLFSACNINTARLPDNPSHTCKAVALIHYCLNGHQLALAHELPIIRVLLALVPDTPLLISPDMLTDSDIQQADAALLAMISHWHKLNNTSIDGLRRAFLQRPGFIQYEDHQTILKLERLGHDVLLDFLPYSLTIVKLPWMHKPIQVSW
ncbi:contractile injection system tape measure protein [Gynuella sp.]|uniref:contractile injection system tape measure protein n=1 Tax=Gynuella sp. TaxID=2969146 RepID=UPI003D117AC3